jgi:hypothetical protein
MLINTKQIYGRKLAALDGLIGHVRDFYFDDKAWVLRYLVADTGSWLPGRLVLLSPHSIAALEQDGKTLYVNLQKKQIEGSPSIEAHKPVSRQYEEDFHAFYGWPAYWQGPQMWGMSNYPIVVPPLELTTEHAKQTTVEDIHLRSSKTVTGYHIKTVDGTIGHVSGFLLDNKSWAIRDLVVEAGPWYSGKEILISVNKIDRVSFEDSEVCMKLTKADIQKAEDESLANAGSGTFGTEYFYD